jgi:hypothetical protein
MKCKKTNGENDEIGFGFRHPPKKIRYHEKLVEMMN